MPKSIFSMQIPKIINANEEETETLQEWLDAFMQTVSVFVA